MTADECLNPGSCPLLKYKNLIQGVNPLKLRRIQTLCSVLLSVDYTTFVPLVRSNLPATWEHYGTVIAALPLMHQLSPLSGPSIKRVIISTNH